MLTDISRLTESPGPLLKRPDGASYYDGEQIITHLNYALGPDGWDWEELERGHDTEAGEVWVMGKLTARIRMLKDEDEGVVERTTVKVERGWQPVNRKRTGELVSLGNDYKGADTDALKRAARLLGVGLDAWAKGGAVQPRTSQRADEPKPMKTKADLVADIGRGVKAARAAGLDVADIDTAKLDRAALVQTITGLADMVRDAQAQNLASG